MPRGRHRQASWYIAPTSLQTPLGWQNQGQWHARGRREMCTEFWRALLVGKGGLGITTSGRKDDIKVDVKYHWISQTGFICSVIETSEISCFILFGEFVDYLTICYLLKKDCTMTWCQHQQTLQARNNIFMISGLGSRISTFYRPAKINRGVYKTWGQFPVPLW